jgi:hypothetical protein
MDLVKASKDEEGGQHMHGWKNITLVKEEVDKVNKILTWPWSLIYYPLTISEYLSQIRSSGLGL